MRLIDADVMMKHLENLLCGNCDTPRKDGWCDVCDYAFLINEMKKEPTVDAELVKHGHWTEIDRGLMWQCSECGHHSISGGHYCDWCGAKMDEVGDVQESD